MHYYRRPMSGTIPGNPTSGNPVDIDAPAKLARGAAALMRSLLPFPGALSDPLASGLSGEGVPDAPALAPAFGDAANAVMRSPGNHDPAIATPLSRTDAIGDAAGAAMPALGTVGDAAGVALPMADSRSVTDQASALLPRAAGILDEEMARGALAARGATAGSMSAHGATAGSMPAHGATAGSMPACGAASSLIPARGATPGAMPADEIAQNVLASSPLARVQETANLLGHSPLSWPMTTTPDVAGSGELVRDLNGFVERFAGLLSRAGGDAERGTATATLTARAPARPGSTSTIEFDLHNEEARAKVLRPMATALISEAGAQLPAQCVHCERTEITLAPGERHTLRLSIQVPAGTPPGCYTGLLVLAGAAQLHSLIQISVASA